MQSRLLPNHTSRGSLTAFTLFSFYDKLATAPAGSSVNILNFHCCTTFCVTKGSRVKNGKDCPVRTNFRNLSANLCLILLNCSVPKSPNARLDGRFRKIAPSFCDFARHFMIKCTFRAILSRWKTGEQHS